MADPAAPGGVAAARAFVDAFTARLEPLELEFNRAQWDASATGTAHDADRRAAADAAVRALLASPAAYREARALRAAGPAGDPLVDRGLEVLERLLATHQMPAATLERLVALETELDHTFNTFRAHAGGRDLTDNELRRVLQSSDDVAERREAWEASKQVGAAVAPRLLELVRLRNEAARALGHRDFYAMMLALDELDETELFATLDQVERDTLPAFRDYRGALDRRLADRFGVAPADVRPWHLADPFFQEAPAAHVDLDRHFAAVDPVEVARRFFAAIGLDVSDVIARSDLYERPGKSQHAFCISIDRGDDVRVLCNLQRDEKWTSVLLHEFGHAVYDRGLDPALPWLLRQAAHTLVTEAVAILFGRLTRSAAWLERWLGVGADEARRTATALAAATREQRLVVTRWCLVMCHMERALYADPDADLAARWWDLVERLQLVHRPDGRTAPDWASKVHFSTAPVYYHGYLLGDLLASQLEHALLGAATTPRGDAWDAHVSSPSTGAWLSERVFRRGRAVDWRTLVRDATGTPLAPDAYIASLAG